MSHARIRIMHAFALAVLACTALPLHAQHTQHAGHDHGQPSAPSTDADEPAQPTSEAPAQAAPLPAFIRTPTPADMAAAFPDLHGMDMRDHMVEDPWLTHVRVDRLERDLGADAATGWAVQAWTGKSRDRLWLESEGARDAHGSHGHLRASWSHATGPWWNRMIGLRRDFAGGLQRDWVGIGVHGHAPYKFDVEAAAFVGSAGRLLLEGKAGYDVLLSNRLILQPEAGIAIHAKDDAAMGAGRGVSELRGGVRLRYEFSREFAPYIGWRYARSFGNTASLRRAEGDAASEHAWLAGIRFNF